MPASFISLCRPTRRHVLSFGVALLAALQGACASDALARPDPVSMAIVERDSDRVLPVYRRAGHAWVAGLPGSRYAVRLTNRTGERVLVVLSVDGINVVSGETAAWNQVGYVLDPWRSYDIAGWRKSDDAIAAFEFAALRDSYAARTGRPGNVGVIGMAVFKEKPAAPPPPPMLGLAEQPARLRAEGAVTGDRATAAAPPAPAMRAAPADKLGTAHGQREWSVVSRTSFERMSNSPQAVVEVGYDSHENLVAAGIIPAPASPSVARAFPLSEPGFVPDPPAR